MRFVWTTLLFVCLAAMLTAQDDPFQLYQQNPTPETYQTAEKQLSASLAENPDDARARLMLGWLHFMETDRLMGWYSENADNLKPGERFGWANLMLAMGQYEDAVAQYKALNEASPKWSCPWRHRGEALYRSGKFEEAEDALHMAIETREEHYDAYVWLAKAQHAQGKNAEALASLEKGFTYLGKDIEDPEEEVDDDDVKRLHADLLDLAGRNEEAAAMRASIKE